MDFRVIIGNDGHADRIEAYHLPDGIGNDLVRDGGGDAEVFQFVVEEMDGVVGGQLVELAQGIREAFILEGMRNLLRMGQSSRSEDKEGQ